MKYFLVLAFVFLLGLNSAYAADSLPPIVQSQAKTPLVPMGSSTYRKFGFSVYRITFWTADGTWNKQKPYALEIRYVRDVSKDTLVDALTDDLKDQNVASDEKLEEWRQILNNSATDIKDGDVIVSLCLPEKEKSPLFYNDKVMLWTGDKTFIQAFFDIWLGPNADEDIRTRLLVKP